MYVINVPIHTHGQDNTVAVWDMFSPMDIFLRNVLQGHRDVSVVDFDEKYIVSASDDKTIKVCEKGEREKGEREKGEEKPKKDGLLNCLIVNSLGGNEYQSLTSKQIVYPSDILVATNQSGNHYIHRTLLAHNLSPGIPYN